jgi:hypothetical protein
MSRTILSTSLLRWILNIIVSVTRNPKKTMGDDIPKDMKMSFNTSNSGRKIQL